MLAPSVDLRPVDPLRVFGGGVAGGGVAGDGAPGTRTLRVGYRAYPDLVPGDAPPLPVAVAGDATGFLILGADGRWTAHGDAPDVRTLLRHRVPAPAAPAPPPLWGTPHRAAHRSAVERCLEAIAAGEIYQACLSTRLDGELRASPTETFLSLLRTAPARRSALLAGGWGAVLSSSPEEHLVRRGRVVTSSPIKGTVPADADPASLRASVKDVAENVMIVDLARHDLGSVADVGSVVVTDLLSVQPAPGVHHLVSTVRAETGVGHDELVSATFPPASVTGTPKLRARELVAGWEPRSRGLHCGVLGLALGDRLETAVAIRTLEAAPDGTVALGVGGGITADSSPAAEWEECLHKAAFAWGGGPPPVPMP